MRTNIVIDDELMRTAMEVSGIPTKKGVVEQAIREFVLDALYTGRILVFGKTRSQDQPRGPRPNRPFFARLGV